MPTMNHLTSLPQPLCNVNTAPARQLSLFPVSPAPALRRHNVLIQIVTYKRLGIEKRYGVSPEKKALPPGVFRKRYDLIVRFLRVMLGYTPNQREVVLRLLRLWSYYPSCYPKASQLAELPGCSRATVFRVLRDLRERGLIQVVNRYVLRERAQISNLYHLRNLVELIVKYLGEHAICLDRGMCGWLAKIPWPALWRAISPASISTA